MGKAKGKAGAAKVKAPRKPRVEPATFLPGMEPPRIKEIDDAATYYYEVMMDRTEKSKEEDQAKTQLIEKMAKNNLDRYRTPEGLVVQIVNKSNVKCKKAGTAEATVNGEPAAG